MTSIAMHNYVRLEDAVNSLSLLIQKVMNGEEVFITQNPKADCKVSGRFRGASEIQETD